MVGKENQQLPQVVRKAHLKVLCAVTAVNVLFMCVFLSRRLQVSRPMAGLHHGGYGVGLIYNRSTDCGNKR